MARLPYVKSYKDRHGKTRHYYRRAGYPQAPLPGKIGSAEFMAAYLAAQEQTRRPVGIDRTQAGTFNALIVAYYESTNFAGLTATTQGNRRAILERFRVEHGDKRVAHLNDGHIRKWMDARKDTPQAANNLLKTLSAIMKFAVERKWRPDNPTDGIKKLRGESDGFHTWTEAEIAKFRERWPLGSKPRLALELLLGTAVRRSDAVELGPQHVERGKISVKPQKTRKSTGKRLKIPLHADLSAAIKATPTGHLSFLVTSQGQPFTAAGFGNWFRDQVDAAGLPPRCAAHGLRKAAARRLAEAGATASQIAAVTGHATLDEVARYTADADQERLAEEAMRTVAEQKASNQAPEVRQSAPQAPDFKAE